jgi:hypothetical protein
MSTMKISIRFGHWRLPRVMVLVIAITGGLLGANSPPAITIRQPAAGAASVPETASIIVEVQDDEPFPSEPFTYLLNGLPPQKGFIAISQSDEGRSLRLELAAALTADMDYVFDIIVPDSDGATNSATIYFDTFNPNSIVIETEDYDFAGGGFIDSPNLTPEGVPDPFAYWGRTGLAGVDFQDLDEPSGMANIYRPNDAVGLVRSSDFQRERFLLAGGTAAGFYDYAVTRVRLGEWLNYTRTFGAAAFKVRLRGWVGGLEQSTVLLEQVLTNGTGNSVVPVGMFHSRPNDGRYETVSLMDGPGQNEVIVRPGAVATLRLSQVTDDPTGEAVARSWLVFIPVEDPGVLRPVLAKVWPLPGEVVESANVVIGATLMNRDTAVNQSSIEMRLNGLPVNPTVVENGPTIDLVLDAQSAGSTNVVEIEFADTQGFVQQGSWSFVVSTGGVPGLEWAAEVAGPYTVDSGAVVDLETATIRVSVTSEARYYRLVREGDVPSPRISSIRLEGGEVVIGYSL